MSFPTTMLGNVDRVHTFTDNNFTIFREASLFFKKYLQLEEEHNRTLQRLCRSTLDNSKSSEQTSLSQGWEDMLVTLESLSREKADQFSRAHTTLDNPLSDQKKQVETNLKSIKADADKFSKDLQNWYATEAKNRGKYQTSFTEWEHAVLNLKAEISSHRKASGFTKTQDKIDHLGKKTSQAKAELLSAVTSLNDYQKQYYQTNLPSVLKRAEELNSFMGQTISNSMKGLSELLLEIDSRNTRIHTEVFQGVEGVDIGSDLTTFSQNNGNPDFQIPRPIMFEELHTSDEVRRVIDDSKPASKRINHDSVSPEILTPSSELKGLSRVLSIGRAPPNLSLSSSQSPPPTSTASRFYQSGSGPTQTPSPPPLARRQVTPASPRPMLVKTLYTCESSGEDELAFREGEILEIFESSGNWWKAKNAEGKIGLVPNNYVQVLSPASDPPPQSPRGEIPPQSNLNVDVDVSVPTLVKRCVEYLSVQKHLETEGIFRIPGDHRLMKELKVRFERGNNFIWLH